VISILSMNEAPPLRIGRGLVSGNALGLETRCRHSSMNPSAICKTFPRSSGVLERSDRVTGCFDGGQGWQSGYTPINRIRSEARGFGSGATSKQFVNSNRDKSKEGPTGRPLILVPVRHDKRRHQLTLGSDKGRAGGISVIQNLMSTTNSPCPMVRETNHVSGCEQIVRRSIHKTIMSLEVVAQQGCKGKRPSVAGTLF